MDEIRLKTRLLEEYPEDAVDHALGRLKNANRVDNPVALAVWFCKDFEKNRKEPQQTWEAHRGCSFCNGTGWEEVPEARKYTVYTSPRRVEPRELTILGRKVRVNHFVGFEKPYDHHDLDNIEEREVGLLVVRECSCRRRRFGIPPA